MIRAVAIFVLKIRNLYYEASFLSGDAGIQADLSGVQNILNYDFVPKVFEQKNLS
jgi:hypothetical protein